jgi:hypothetical protein
MGWVRLDDDLGDDPRIAAAGTTGVGVLVLALCYSNRNLTDGWFPESVLERFFIGSTAEAAAKQKDSLLEAKVLSPQSRNGLSGFQIQADYVALQPSRAQVLKQRSGRTQQKVAAGRLGGIASGRARQAQLKQTRSTNEAEGKHGPSTSEPPVPDPDLQDKSTGAAAPASPSRVQPFEIATHSQLCKVYADVLRAEGGSSAADRKEAFRLALRDLHMKADPSDPEALRKAMDVVERAQVVVRDSGSRLGHGDGLRRVGVRG